MDSGSEEVKIISPNYSASDVVSGKTSYSNSDLTLEDIHITGYPKLLVDFDVELERLFFSNEIRQFSITIDTQSGSRSRNDVRPNLETYILPKSALISPRLDDDTATERGRKLVRRQIYLWYASSVLVNGIPEIEAQQIDKVFKLFWVIPTPSEKKPTLIDSISGEVKSG